MSDDKKLISLRSHPKWQAKQATKPTAIPESAQGPITHWDESKTETHKTIHISIAITQTNAIDAHFIMPMVEPENHAHARAKQLKMFKRAHTFGHDIRADLLPLPDGRIMITQGEDITETMLQEGPFGQDRLRQCQDDDTKSANAFLLTAGTPYGLSQSQVAKLWTWPVHDCPELEDNLHAFHSIPPRQIGTSTEERQGLHTALVIGNAQESYGQENSTVQRLQSAQGRWDKLGTMVGAEGPTLLHNTFHARLPLVAALAAGSAGHEENDITLPGRTNAVWENVGPQMIQQFCKGKMQTVFGRAQKLEAMFQKYPELNSMKTMQSAAKAGLKNPQNANAIVSEIAQSIYDIPLEKEQAGALFLGTMTRTPSRQQQER